MTTPITTDLNLPGAEQDPAAGGFTDNPTTGALFEGEDLTHYDSASIDRSGVSAGDFVPGVGDVASPIVSGAIAGAGVAGAGHVLNSKWSKYGDTRDKLDGKAQDWYRDNKGDSVRDTFSNDRAAAQGDIDQKVNQHAKDNLIDADDFNDEVEDARTRGRADSDRFDDEGKSRTSTARQNAETQATREWNKENNPDGRKLTPDEIDARGRAGIDAADEAAEKARTRSGNAAAKARGEELVKDALKQDGNRLGKKLERKATVSAAQKASILAAKKLGGRMAAMGAAMMVPGLGQAVAVGMALWTAYDVIKGVAPLLKKFTRKMGPAPTAPPSNGNTWLPGV